MRTRNARLWMALGPLLAATPAAVPGAAIPATAAPPGLQIPAFTSRVLDNGLRLQMLRHATVPLVDLELWIDAGALRDPGEKSGLAALTAEALRKGAGGHTAQEFSDAVDLLGADYTASAELERVRIHMNLLAKDLDRGLELFADAVLRPAFPAGEVEKLAAQLSESVAQSKDNPRNVLGDYHAAFVFGDHPYGNAVGGTETGLAGITREDVVGFYRAFYGADRAVLTVAGDVDVDAIAARVAGIFGSMPRAEGPAAVPPPPAPRTGGPAVLLVDKTDTPQTWFRAGGVCPGRDHPDYAASELVRTVFGGRFTSWLNSKLRIETGLTYGARFVIARYRSAGHSYLWSFTASETTKEAMDLALAQLDRLHTEGIEPWELESAKAYYKGQTPYEYETAGQLGAALTELAFYGEDRERLDGLFDRIDAVSLEDCRRVIGAYFSRDNLTITTIGVASEVQDVLAGYGPVTVRANTDAGFR